MNIKIKQQKWYRRHKRVRAKIFGTAEKPRLCIFRSNKHIYAQLIDDQTARIIASVSDFEVKKTNKDKGLTRKINAAFKAGEIIAQKALKKKIKEAVFDRRGYKYHGRVKAVAEGARKAGLKF